MHAYTHYTHACMHAHITHIHASRWAMLSEPIQPKKTGTSMKSFLYTCVPWKYLILTVSYHMCTRMCICVFICTCMGICKCMGYCCGNLTTSLWVYSTRTFTRMRQTSIHTKQRECVRLSCITSCTILRLRRRLRMSRPQRGRCNNSHMNVHMCLHVCGCILSKCLTLCMYICMYICIYACMCICICIYLCMHACMHVSYIQTCCINAQVFMYA